MELTEKYIDQLISSDPSQYYSTLQLNQTLYLHYKGIFEIKNLEKFTNLKVLFLEGNGLTKIENLDCLVNLCQLFLHENCIMQIENLEKLQNLQILNLSYNEIKKIENLQILNIQTLYLQKNKIGINGIQDFEQLAQLQTITTLDISNNYIEDKEILYTLQKMENLKVLYLNGNDAGRKIENYRKQLTYAIKKLTFLDDRPISDEDRQFANVFYQEGHEGELRLRQQIKDQNRQKQLIQIQNTNLMLQRQRELGINQLPLSYRRPDRAESDNSKT